MEDTIVPRKLKKTKNGNSTYILLPPDINQQLGEVDELNCIVKKGKYGIYLAVWGKQDDNSKTITE